jgi:hypothetical protein
VVGINCTINIVEDDLSDGGDRTTKPGGTEPFRCETGIPAGSDTDHDVIKDEAEDLLKAGGWHTVGDWEQTDHGYYIAAERD